MGIISEQINGKIINVDITSSNIKSAQYDTETETLTVTFNNGGIYEYYKFPWSHFTKFRMAESQGKFFNTNINGKYKFQKIKRRRIKSTPRHKKCYTQIWCCQKSNNSPNKPFFFLSR